MSVKSANATIIGQRYATAFFSAGISPQEINNFLELGKRLTSDVLFSEILNTTKHSHSAQKNTVKWVQNFCETLKISQKVTNFLALIALKNRLQYLSAITKAVEDMANQKAGRDFVDLVLFAPASDTEIATIIQENMKHIKPILEPILNIIINPKILGGYIIRTKSVVIDSSLRKNIEKLHNVMKGVA